MRLLRLFAAIHKMNSDWQTTVALFTVAAAVAWLVVYAIRKRKSPGCGSEECGAVSPEIKRLQAKLKKK